MYMCVRAICIATIPICRRKSKKRGGISLESNGKRKKKKDLFDTSIELTPRSVTVKPLDEPPVVRRVNHGIRVMHACICVCVCV